MKRTAIFILAILTSTTWAQKPWQQLTHPLAREVAVHFKSPPPEYAITMTWGWDGPITEEVIKHDLDLAYQRGFRAVTIEAGYDMKAPYLSPGWFKTVRMAADQAKIRGMRIWIIDEGKYPSGFAGGKFTLERPDLRMMGLGVARRWSVANGESVTRDLPKHTVGVLAINLKTHETLSLDISKGKINWTAPQTGQWRLFVMDYNYRTPVTRAVNDPTRAKTRKNSMGDLLNPVAVRQLITWTHAQYKKYLGPELGTTVLGLRGDEPEFATTPWTPSILDLFKQQKGYDVAPYLPYFVNMSRRDPPLILNDKQRRAKADYWDVWSRLFGQNYFGQLATWCAANGAEYMVHLDHEDRLDAFTRTGGGYFRDLRQVEIPGVDSIWNQVWPGHNADFIRLPASVAHVYGKARVLSESFAAYNQSPVTVKTACWCVNYQMVRGVNLFEFMFYPASSRPQTQIRQQYSYMADPNFPVLMAAANRACYVMSQGRSDARIAVYYPSMSFWIGDYRGDKMQWELTRQLLEHQRDFDLVDDDAFAQTLTLQGNRLVNLSGQSYQTVIIPAATAISKRALDHLHAFAQAGGKVVIVGDKPNLVVDRSFMQAVGPGDLSWTQQVSEPTFDRLAADLPPADMALDSPYPDLTVMHKRWQDADLYFMFNEAHQPLSRKVTLAGQGVAQSWDTRNGTMTSLSTHSVDGKVSLDLKFSPYEAKLIVVTPAR